MRERRIADASDLREPVLCKPAIAFRGGTAVNKGDLGAGGADLVARRSHIGHRFAAERAAERTQEHHQRG
jgi:hypothetical protein